MSRQEHLKKPFAARDQAGLSVVLPEAVKPASKAIEVELPKAKVIEVELPKKKSKKRKENPHSGNASFKVVEVAPVAPEVPKKLRKLSAPTAKESAPKTAEKAADAAKSTKPELKSKKTPKRRRFSLGLPKGSTPKNYSNRLTLPELINAESAIGRTLFGPIPVGHQREFFTSRRNVWIWHESWTDQLGRVQKYTVRYEVRPEGVFKRAGNNPYERIVGDELDNFRATAKTYLNLVKQNLYS